MAPRRTGAMQDTELFRYLLGIEPPWEVETVELDVKSQRVDIWVVHEEGLRWSCPECGALVPLYDHAQERVWRHLDSCQFMTYLHARPPRVECPEHGVRRGGGAGAERTGSFLLRFCALWG